ncbi:hypothetical protein LTR56_023592 [Elasticomyces elasticus]|nr:hypothetical protein LTR56_023592 [Elasticomyces elasticus]KAK3662402.1 hypothetical protein LTR22_006681 [Elasticomyces elasticus]KAK4926391.1 hypothetical protein LTR49_006598 [Elasticomyces elasticus]KAK5761236.1 hypothetical protein LTS12_008717 [Elasticomyces elasticus]
MATDIFSQWEQVRTIMDNYQARIQRLDAETEELKIELESLEQRGGTLLESIDTAAKQRIKLFEAMEAMARRISQGVLDSTVPAQAELSPPATPYAMEMPSARVIAKASRTSRESDLSGGLPQAVPPVGDLILPATPASAECETPTTYHNEDDDEHDDDDDHESVDAAFAAMDARTAKAEASVKRKRDSSPAIGCKNAPVSSNQTVGTPPSKKVRKLAECIHPTFPTIVSTLDGSGWVELRWGYCSCNAVLQRQTLLKGIAGFKQHYRTRHHDKLEAEEQFTSTHILEHAAYHHLLREEADKLLAGDTSAYHVPRLVGDVKKCTKRSKAKDEVAKGGSN